MSIFDMFPFTNLHELNLDWVIKQIKNLSESVETLDTDKQDKLTAGANITIDANNVISATGGGASTYTLQADSTFSTFTPLVTDSISVYDMLTNDIIIILRYQAQEVKIIPCCYDGMADAVYGFIILPDGTNKNVQVYYDNVTESINAAVVTP